LIEERISFEAAPAKMSEPSMPVFKASTSRNDLNGEGIGSKIKGIVDREGVLLGFDQVDGSRMGRNRSA
jgi:hypothetical protein